MRTQVNILSLSKILRFSVILVVIFIQNSAHTQNTLAWQKCYGGPQSNAFEGICETSDGGFLLVGSYCLTGGDFSSNYGLCDVGLIKIDSIGNKLWSHHYGLSYNDGCNAIIKGFNNRYYIIGTTYSYGLPNFHGFPEVENKSDGYVICVDDAGNLIWQHCYGGYGSDYLHTGAVIDSNYLYAAGITIKSNGGDTGGNYAVDTVLGSYDVFICKIRSSDGSLVHAKRLGGTKNDVVQKMIVTDANKLLLVGESNSIDIDVPVCYGIKDAWALKIDTGFNVLTSHIWGGAKRESFYDALQTSDKGYMLYGFTENTDTLTGNLNISITSSTVQLLLIKTDSNFNALWQKTYGCDIKDLGSSSFGAGNFIHTNDNGFIMGTRAYPSAGCTSYPFADGHSLFIKTDAAGNVLFERQFGTNLSGTIDVVRSIIETKDGGMIIGSTGNTDNNNFCNSAGVNPSCFWNVYKIDSVSTNTIGISNPAWNNCKVFPNPANHYLTIDSQTPIATAEIFDISGKLLLSALLHNNQLDISQLASGLYFIKLSTLEGSVVRKFIKN